MKTYVAFILGKASGYPDDTGEHQMALKQSLKQTQRLSLTPQLRQSLSMLAMSQLQLQEVVEAEIAENPILKQRENSAPAQYSEISTFEVALETIAAPVSLGDSLVCQIGLMSLSIDVKETAIFLIGDLTYAGYVQSDIAELKELLGQTDMVMENALSALQSCEPVGIGARSLAECLTIQLIAAGIDESDAALIAENLETFALADWGKLKNLSGWTMDTIERYAGTLRSLTPSPAENFSPIVTPIVPDIIAALNGAGQIDVALPYGVQTDLVVNTALLAKANTDENAKDFTEQMLQRANAIIRATQFRGKTLLRLSQAIVAHQYRFFSGDRNVLDPLSQLQLAKMLDVHPTTVSRAISQKFMQLDGLVYPLSFFLSHEVSDSEKTGLSAYTVQQIIRGMIAQENPNSPLSDNDILNKLRADGVDIARRTVAKYRGCLNIPSSFERRRNLALKRTRPTKAGGINSVK